MTVGRQKSDDEGKKEQKLRAGKKKVLKPNRGLKSRVHRHTMLEECRVSELQFAADPQHIRVNVLLML
jgi:hypothetical protein